MRNYTTGKNNSAAVVIQPDKRHEWQIVLIGSVCAIKNNDVSEILLVKSGLTISPKQSLQMANVVNQVPEEKIRISLSPRHHVHDHHFSITGTDCILLISMAEIINVTLYASNLIKSTVLNAQNIHNMVFADPRFFHVHNVHFLLIANSSVRTQQTRKIPWG
jgi:hypothetical protein